MSFVLQKREFRVTKNPKNVSFVLQKREFRVTRHHSKIAMIKVFLESKNGIILIIILLAWEN